jgi:hypothetical protein
VFHWVGARVECVAQGEHGFARRSESRCCVSLWTAWIVLRANFKSPAAQLRVSLKAGGKLIPTVPAVNR